VARIIQRSFTSGEIAPGLRVRADLGKYATALESCTNMFVRSQGGVYSRPGFRFVGEIGDSTKQARLIPFSFNTEQTYMLLFEEGTIRIIKDGAYIMDGGSPYEVVSPYQEVDLPRIGYTQSADVMTLVHPSYEPRNLSRLADDNWTLAVIDFGTTVDPPANLVAVATGTGGSSYNKTYDYVITTVGDDGSESIASTKVTITLNSLSSTYGVKLTYDAATGADYYKVYKADSVNSDVYGFIGETRSLEFSDFNIAPDLSIAPPQDREPFTDADNRPSAVNYYQQRAIYANTNDEPQTVYTTQTSNYRSLRTSSPARADDAVTFTIAGRQVNEIRHIVALDALILLTSGGEWRVTEGQDEVLAPDTVGVRIQSYNGCNWVPPVIVNDTVVFVQSSGARIRDLGYTFTSDKYTGSDLSIMSEHLFEGYEIKEMTYTKEPYSIVWCVRDDGMLLGMTYQREQEVWGWHKHTTDGLFESAASITEDNKDSLYVIVNRTIDGNTVRYVERMDPREETNPEDCFYVDSGLSYNGTPVTTLSGLDHLEGEDVAVLADGNVVNGLTVTSGEITLPYAASVVHAGLAYTPELVTLAVDNPQEAIKGSSFSVGKVKLIVDKSRGGWIGPVPRDADPVNDVTEIKPRFVADGYSTIALRSQEVEVNVKPSWNKRGQVRIQQRDPLPLGIVAIIPEIDIGG